MKPKKVKVSKLKEIIRLKHEANLSLRQIADSTGVSKTVISKYLQRAEDAGLAWPLPVEVDDSKLQTILQPARNSAVSALMVEPNFAEMSTELSRKGMTRQLHLGRVC